MTTTDDEQVILDLIRNSETRITPLVLIKQSVKKTQISSASARKIIKNLVAQKKLSYTYFFGSTYIEISFDRPVKISDHFVLTPAGIKNNTYTDNIIDIVIDPGLSFGSGRHPTTRLALQALDHVLINNQIIHDPGHTDTKYSGLDIGTGSGVLAIAACKTTIITKCLALDIDQNSIVEAKRNIYLNNLENQIKVSDQNFENLNRKFSLIMANLRYPSLKKLAEKIHWLSHTNSVLIMSGIRTYEKNDLINVFIKKNFNLLWKMDNKNWSCILMQLTNK